jgi:hypothetical protein
MNLDTLPVPTDADGPARVKVTTVGNMWTLAWARNGGITVEPFGQPYSDVQRACRDAARLNERSEI